MKWQVKASFTNKIQCIRELHEFINQLPHELGPRINVMKEIRQSKMFF